MPESQKKTSLFMKIENGADAANVVRDASRGFFFVAALQGVLGLFLAPALIVDGVVLAGLAGALMKWRSRAAAVLLLLVSGLQAVVTVLNRLGVMHEGGRNVILSVIMLITAVRAVEATFKLNGNDRSRSPRPAGPSSSPRPTPTPAPGRYRLR